jgi:hypothetical protein
MLLKKLTENKVFRHSPQKVLLAMVFLLIAAPLWAATYTHTYSIDKPAVHTLSDGTALVELTGGGEDDKTVGAPILPTLASRLYVPDGEAVVSVDVTLGAMQALAGTYVLAHGTTPRPLADKAAPAPEPADPAIYASSAPYPAQVSSRQSDQRLNGYRIVMTTCYPVRYTPATGLLEYSRTVTVTITTKSVNEVPAAAIMPRNAISDIKAVQAVVDNDEAFSGATATANAVPLDSSRQYLLITTNALQSAFTPLLTHRASSAGGGFTAYATTVESIAASQSGQDLAEKIRNFIKDSYTNHGAQYVVLGGDADGVQASQAVPTRGCSATVDSFSDTYIPSDLYYACLDGTWDANGNGIFGETTDGTGGGDIDWLPELAVGRIPADSIAEAQTAVNKIIAYETSTNKASAALLVGEQLDATPTWGGDRMDYVYQVMNSMLHTTLYDRDVSDHAWTVSTLMNLLSSDNFGLVFHLGHSNENYNMRMGNDNLDSITNAKYFFVYSQGCYSNSFDGRSDSGSYSATDSIGEDFLVRNSYNAYAYIGNSRYGWYNSGSYVAGASNLLHRNFANAAFQNNITRIGPANNASKLGLNFSEGVYRWLAFEVNLMGDPATPLNISCDDTAISTSITSPSASFAVLRRVATTITTQVRTGCSDALIGAAVTAAFSNGDTGITLYDDGAHNDGAANDGAYGGVWTSSHSGAVTITVTASKAGYTAGTDSVTGAVVVSNYGVTNGAYAWVDDSTATDVLTSEDDATAALSLGFTFPFYGVNYTSLVVDSNGMANFSGTTSYPNNASIPNTAQPNNFIAPFWDDLVLEDALGSRITYMLTGAAPNRVGVLTWHNLKHYGESVATAPATFQALLYEGNGVIKFQYANVTFAINDYTGGASATVGVENAEGSAGMQYSYRQASLSAGQCLVFTPVNAAAPSAQGALFLLLQH